MCRPALHDERQLRAYLASGERLARALGWNDVADAASRALDLARRDGNERGRLVVGQ